MGALSEEVAAKVRRQVEFYFSDSNLPNDKFLLSSIEDGDDGLVSLPVVCSFTKMRGHLGIREIGPDNVPKEVAAAVADVLRKSSSLRLSDDGLRVGRANKLLKPEEARADLNSRSFAVSPLPWKATREQVEAFFEGYATVLSIRMPRHPTAKVFSGFAVVEFSTAEEAQKVAGMALSYQGATLEFQPKEHFDKYMESLAQNDDRNERREYQYQDRYPKGLIVSIKLEKKKKGEEGSGEAKAPPGEETQKKDTEVKADATEETEGETKDEGKADTDEITREDLKAVLQQYGTVKFIEFSKGNTSGYIRFESSEDADKARTAAVLAEDGGLIIKGYVATLEAVQGDAENEYWKKVYGNQARRREDGGNRRREDGGNNRYKDRRFGKKDKNKQKYGKDSKSAGYKEVKATGKHLRLDEDDDGKEDKLQRTE